MSSLEQRAAEILAQHAAGALSSEVALMELLIASEDVARVEALLSADAQPANAPLVRALSDNRAGCLRIAQILREEQPQPAHVSSPEASIEATRGLFDQLVQQSEEASVALYSLGNPRILAAASAEIVSLLQGWALLGRHVRVVDLGCGIGRIERALASRVASIVGLDVSPKMVEVARGRTADLPNVQIELCSGRELACCGDGSAELLLAIDSFPYVMQAGLALAESLFAEARRVLVPTGSFVIFNVSYRDDLAQDERDVARLAQLHGFTLELAGERPFKLWNGAAFRLRGQERVD